MQSVLDARPDATSAPTRRVAVVGGGASGVLTAINLLAPADPNLRVTLYESAADLGAGVAYGTTDARHLLNVRARHMSAFPDVPSDLIDWAESNNRPVDRTAFLPRRDYACYLRDRLGQVADRRLQVVRARVEDVVPSPGGFEVHAEGSVSATADAVVLAYGNQAPRPLAVDAGELPLDAPWHVTNPWHLGWVETLSDDATVVLVGTGLTAIDTAITVLDAQPGRQVIMTSRSGMLPRAHIDQQSTAWVSPVPSGELTADQLAAFFVEQVSAAARQGVNWRNVVDGLRGATQSMWLRLPLAERRRFLALHAREWEVRRHRMAPEIAARVADYRREGRLRVVPGGIRSVDPERRRCRVLLTGDDRPVSADAVVNCTGPETDASQTKDPLLQRLRERSLVAPDQLRLGLDCTSVGELLDPTRQVVPGLFAVGPPRKGCLYESTAVPEIRAQAAQVASLLLTVG
ncbi:MAG: hypothetical protein JWO46_2473 [Nocardioidaceae bacterium]|nr:hypothetical protein [Nocardioidaceae bacterium]